MITARDVVGRRIVEYRPGLFPDGKGGWAHDPVLVLDNGAFLAFNTEETETGEYGTSIVIGKPGQRPRP